MRTLLLAMAFIVALTTSVFAADVKVSWDANKETDLAGYRVRLNGGTWVDVKNTLTYTFVGVPILDGVNTAEVVAYDAAGHTGPAGVGTLDPNPAAPINVRFIVVISQ